MTTQPPPSYEEALAEAKRSLANQLSSAERIEFTKAAIAVLEDNDQVQQFEREIDDVGRAAIEIDANFDRVTRTFNEMVDEHGNDFPELAQYKTELDGYKERWVKYLWDSRDVASGMSAVLRRYDQVFLEMVDSIKTDEDRLAVIGDLLDFSRERHAGGAEMSFNFRILEVEIRGFSERFGAYLEHKRVEFDQLARFLTFEIGILVQQIAALIGAIAESILALAIGLAGALWKLVDIPGIILTGINLTILTIQLLQARTELNAKKTELAEVNRKQHGLAELKTTFDGLKLDIAPLWEKLVVFGNIWEIVSAQCADFIRHLITGMEALEDEEFRLQVTLARKSCTPLRNGLAKYATRLGRSTLSKL